MHRLQDLVRLHRMGEDARSVARQLKMSPNTERKYRAALEQEGLLVGAADEIPEIEVLLAAVDKHHPAQPAPQEESSIEAWTAQIEHLLESSLEPKAIYDRLRLEHPSFDGSYWAVKRTCKRLRKSFGPTPEEIAIPVETEPGAVAQVDFGEIAKLYDPEQGVLRRAWVFVLVLGFSRHMFAKVVFDQKIETWIRLHIEAFKALGGVPKVIVPDNLKAAVVRAAFAASGTAALNRSYRELARYYGFKVDPVPAYAPKKKGKVESSVKYVKNNALAGRDGEEIEIVNLALEQWVREIAGKRMHGTTGRQPLDVFESTERACLLPLPSRRFDPVIWKQAKVHPDVHVSFERALYSVPWRLKNQKIWVRGTSTTVAIYDADEHRVATHVRGRPGSRTTREDHLPEGRRDLRHQSREYWEKRAAGIGPEAIAYVREVFESDDVLYQLRVVQAIVSYLEKFPVSRAEAACTRARFFGNYSYQGIKRILTRALDLEPLPTVVPSEVTAAFRFARNVADLWSARTEATREPN